MSQPAQPRASLSLFPNPNASSPPRNQTPLGRRSESRERRAPTPQQYHHQQPSYPHHQDYRAASPPASTMSRQPTPQQHYHLQDPRAPSPSVISRQQTPQIVPQQAVAMTFSAPTAQPQIVSSHTAATVESPTQRQEQLQQQYQYQQPQPQQMWPLPQQQQQQPEVVVQRPSPVAFAEDQTPVQHHHNRSSIAKPPLSDDPLGIVASPDQPLRSMFPTYNPDVALEHQQYMPTQRSPTHIPRAVISRQGTYMNDNDEDDDGQLGVRSPDRSAEPARRWPRIPQEAPAVPTPCTTEQLKSLWRVANGWRASPSEGRVYCLKLSQERDAPVYTLGSKTQPFWNLRLDPTSASARASLSRHDPAKPFKPHNSDSPSSSILRGSIGSGGNPNRKSLENWQEALSTTLEEESRRQPPNDGLVALLKPVPAAKMETERSDAPGAVQMAENESAKLVWDDDTATYFLVHGALAKPFFISIERSPAWSRTEYTLEHTESPQHLAKLTRDGSGGGWLEVDTGLASKIDSFFILDVTVAALLLVASADEKNSPTVAVESFEAPPPPQIPEPVRSKKQDKASKKNASKIQEFEIDLESQDGSFGKDSNNNTKVKEKKMEDKLPFVLRVVVKLTKGFFKMFIFFLTAIAKCFGLMFKGCYKCFGSKY